MKRKERINPFQRRNFHCSGRWQYSTGLAHPGTNAIPDQIHPFALHEFGFRSGCSAIPWLPTLSSLQKIVFTVCLEACASCLPQLNPNIPCNYLSSGLSPLCPTNCKMFFSPIYPILGNLLISLAFHLYFRRPLPTSLWVDPLHTA